MNKQDALKRIEAIEAEAKELRKIVEGSEEDDLQPGELVYYKDHPPSWKGIPFFRIPFFHELYYQPVQCPFQAWAEFGYYWTDMGSRPPLDQH